VRCACQFKIKHYLLVNRHCDADLFQFARPRESRAAS
jgi:hypothetical protein